MLVVVEGFDGAGKDTAIDKIVAQLKDAGITAHVFIEPGGTENGKVFRKIVKSVELSSFQQLMLFNASREELYRTCIKPLLDAGEFVITNRGVLSSYAYQVLDLPTNILSRRNWLDLCNAATHNCIPDAVLFMDTPFDTCVFSVDNRGEALDVIEQQSNERLKVIHTRMRGQLTTVYPLSPITLINREAKSAIKEAVLPLINMHKTNNPL